MYYNTKDTYWNSNGKYQELYKEIFKYVPKEGDSNDTRLQAVISVNRLYYDIFNNGGWNTTSDAQPFLYIKSILIHDEFPALQALFECFDEENLDDDGESRNTDHLMEAAYIEAEKMVNKTIEWIKFTGFLEEKGIKA